MVFARIVLGHLYAYPELIEDVDAIIPMPAYIPTQEPRMGNDHTGYVIERAIEEDDRDLPFILDPPLIEKTKPTTKMRATTSAAERKHVAGVLHHYLTVPDPEAVTGTHIMSYDDVFTGGEHPQRGRPTTQDSRCRRSPRLGARPPKVAIAVDRLDVAPVTRWSAWRPRIRGRPVGAWRLVEIETLVLDEAMAHQSNSVIAAVEEHAIARIHMQSVQRRRWRA